MIKLLKKNLLHKQGLFQVCERVYRLVKNKNNVKYKKYFIHNKKTV